MKRYNLTEEVVFLLVIPLVVAVFTLAALSGCPWPGPDPGTLTIDTEPVKGGVFVDSENLGIAPQTKQVAAGVHMVTFSAVAGYRTPGRQQVDVPEGGEKVVAGVYIKGNPPPVQKLRVLVVYESDYLDNMPPDQADIFGNKGLRDWLVANCEKENGQPAFRMLDRGNDVSRLSQWWQDEFAKAKAQPLPCLVVVNPSKRFDGPLPVDAEAMLELLVQYTGEK